MKELLLVMTMAILLLNCSNDESKVQSPSLASLQKIYDNAGGKGDATSITMEDLKATGVDNLVATKLSGYQTAIAVKMDFSDPAKVGEVQTLVEEVNNIQDQSIIALQKIYDNAGGKGDATAITMEDLQVIGIENLVSDNLLKYQSAIAVKMDFTNPAKVAEVQTLVEEVNNIQDQSIIALQKIYDNAGGKGDATAITIEDLKATGVENLVATKLSGYQTAIAVKMDFSDPAKVAEVQTLVEEVNNIQDSSILLTPITPTEEQTSLLNTVFPRFSYDGDYDTRYHVIVIKSTEDLAGIYSGDISRLNIDFTKYFIIAGSVWLPNQPNRFISQELYTNAENDMFRYHITIDNRGDAPALERIGYWAIYPLTTITDENVITTFKYIQDSSILLTPITPTEEQTNLLNTVFTGLAYDADSDNTHVIKNTEDLAGIYSGDISRLNIDFTKYFIIGGKVLTPAVTYTLISQELYTNAENDMFKYDVTIEKCADCFTAIGYLYYWSIYPLNANINSKNVTTTFEYIEP